MISRRLFFVIVAIFVSHNVASLWRVFSGTQPFINTDCPLAITLINAPLLFDREELFFNTQYFKLSYPDTSVTLSRKEIRPGLFSYFDMLYFSHWGKYQNIPGANKALLTHYFCKPTSFLEKLHLSVPQSLTRQILDSKGQILLEETIQCQK